ncbi:MAG: DUF4355 domain-containing protein [Clostridiales bacterium]|nr:DUF4355 domain-containing protein [Clostridiales bacterium]
MEEAMDEAMQEIRRETPDPEQPANTKPGEPKPADLNALLKADKALQSQFDRQIAKALDTAKSKWEAEKNLSAEQLAQQKAQERAAELAQREAELTRRELRAAALEQMSQRGLPTELLDAISVDDEVSMTASLDKTEKAFRAAVDKAVKDKMKGDPPKFTPTDPSSTQLAAIRAAAGLK